MALVLALALALALVLVLAPLRPVILASLSVTSSILPGHFERM
jgi:hypothetical protein